MVLSAEPLGRALSHVKKKKDPRPVIFLTPQGEKFDHVWAKDLAKGNGAIFLSGRYGGIDERIREKVVDHELSIGDFVIMGGELAAMVILEATARFIPGVLGNEDSSANDSFQKGLLEGPQYTRPKVYEGMEVPKVLLSGDHKAISRWRKSVALERTQKHRPDLLRGKKRNIGDRINSVSKKHI